jgi:hypothetical protein
MAGKFLRGQTKRAQLARHPAPRMIANHHERRVATAACHTEGRRFVLPKQSGFHP